MQQVHLDATLEQAVEDGEERLHLAATLAHVEVLEVGGADP